MKYQGLNCSANLTWGRSACEIRSPQIWPHLPALLVRSLLRFAAFCNLNSLSRLPRAIRVGILRRHKKEHDAKFFLALAVLSLSFSTGAVAQPQDRSGTPEEQAACSRDVQRYCRQVIDQGDFTVLACLQQNRSKISKACDQVLKNHGQ
jgi:hypothetical protein